MARFEDTLTQGKKRAVRTTTNAPPDTITTHTSKEGAI